MQNQKTKPSQNTNSHFSRLKGFTLALSAVLFIVTLSYLWNNAATIEPVRSSDKVSEFKKNGVPFFEIPQIRWNSNAEVQVISKNDKQLTLSKLSSQVVLINFWASWCKPCIDEIPSLQKLANSIGDESKFKILAVSVDEDFGRLGRFLKSVPEDSSMVVGWDGKASLAKKFGVEKLPESFLVDNQGKLIMKIVGYQDWNAKEFRSFLESRL